MYSDKIIDLDDLLNNNTKYDIDHIYPYSQSGDDSINNRVLVLKDENNVKQDSYPLSEEIRIKNASRWKMLRDKNLISEENIKDLLGIHHLLMKNYLTLQQDKQQKLVNQ